LHSVRILALVAAMVWAIAIIIAQRDPVSLRRSAQESQQGPSAGCSVMPLPPGR